MNANVSKTNTGKLLAAVLVMAMVIAGAAVVFSEESVDAATSTASIDKTLNPLTDAEISTDGDYYATGDITAKITGGTVNIYLVNGAEVTFSSATGTIKVYAATNGSAGVAPTKCIDGLSLTLAGSATTVTNTNNNLVVANDGVAASGNEYGISVKGSTNTVFYGTRANAGTVNIVASDVVTVIDGSVVVSQAVEGASSNTLNFRNVTSAATGTTVTVTATDATKTTLNGTIASGTVSVTSGTVTAGAALNVVKTEDTVKTSLLNAVASNTIAQDVTLTSSLGANQSFIYGTYELRSTLGAFGDPAEYLDVTVTEGSTFIINNGVTASVKSLTSTAGTTKVFGNLMYTAADDVEGNILLGPNGYIGGEVTATGLKNTNVTSGQDYYINGIPSSPSVGDAIISSDLTIPEGMTFTVTVNLGLNNETLTVNGTLVIDSRASVYGFGSIVLGEKGTITNNGSIGAKMPVTVSNGAVSTPQTVTIVGVSGVSFGYATIDDAQTLVVTGDVSAVSGSTDKEITLANGAGIGSELIIGKNVKLNLGTEDVSTVNNAAITINGTMTGTTDKTLRLNEGSTFTSNGAIDTVTVIAVTGEYADRNGAFTETASGSPEFTLDNIKGVTIYTKKVTVADGDDTKYYLRAYVNGTADINSKDGTGETLGITGAIYVASSETLTITEDVKANIAGVTVEGTIVTENGLRETTGTTTDNIVYTGASYVIATPGENNTETLTGYYTTLAAAMAAIGTADDNIVYTTVANIEIDVTIGADQTLVITGTPGIASDAVVTVEVEGTVTGTIGKVDGKLVVEDGAICNPPSEYDVMSTSEDLTVTYAGFAVAIAEAQPGDVITVTTGQIGKPDAAETLTIPNGVTVNVTESLEVYGNLTVAEGATLTGGNITVNPVNGRESRITVNGTLDLSEGMLNASNANITSTGTSIFAAAPANFNGAYYIDADGNTVVTTVAKAVAYVTENDGDAVNVKGKVSESGALSLDGVNLVIDTAGEVVLGDITLNDATVTATGAKLTANVTAMNGEGDAAANGTVALSASGAVLASSNVTSAAGVTTYTYAINAISGTVTVQSGTAVISGNVTTADESKFTVASGATLLVAKNGGVLNVSGNKSVFTVDGTLDVDGQVNFEYTATTGETDAVINGTMDIAGAVEADKLVINGTVNVVSDDTTAGSFTVTGTGVAVGDVKKAMGSTGSIVGIITFSNDGKYVIAYAGTDMSGAKLANDAEFETTAFYVNDALYATVYANSAVQNTSIITDSMIRNIPGIDKDTTKTITWATADGTSVTLADLTIGQYDAAYAKAPLDQIEIKVSVGTGISLYVDNVKIVSETYDLTIGTHTVSATVNPGYAGEVTISFNGQTVTGGSIDITVDSEGVVLSALGDISVDTGSTSGGDSGMGLTEILLVILVILIVVMAIMVALRLMRS